MTYRVAICDDEAEQAKHHLDEVRSIHNEMRGYKHDFHHHLQALKGQLEAGETDRAIVYIEQLDKSLQSVDTLLKTGNVTVDAILSAKIAQVKAEGIAVTVEANIPDHLTLTDLELSIVIGNLLDNAIEACREAGDEKFIRLSIRMKGKMMYFYMLNSAGGKKVKVGSLFQTGKSGAHGFGLHRAEAILESHGGWVKYNSEDGGFTSEFLVPAVEFGLSDRKRCILKNKSEKKKPYRSAWNNAIWSFCEMLRSTPKSFWLMAAGVPLAVFLAWADIRLPALDPVSEYEVYRKFNEISGGKYAELWNAQAQYYTE